MVRFHDILLERPDDVSRARNNDVPSVRLLDVSNKSQMKHPTTSQSYVIKTPQWYVSMTSQKYFSTASPVRHKWNTQNVTVVRLHHVSELRCCDALLVGPYYVFKLLFHDFHLIAFYVSFKYQIKHQNFIALTSRETRRVVSIIHYHNFYYI